MQFQDLNYTMKNDMDLIMLKVHSIGEEYIFSKFYRNKINLHKQEYNPFRDYSYKIFPRFCNKNDRLNT